MATGGARPVIEAIIRARDEASAVFSQVTKKIADDAKGLDRELQSVARSASSFGGQLSSTLTLLGPGLAAAAVVAADLWASYSASVADAAKQQVAMNEALQGTSAAPFVAELKKMNDALAESAELRKSFVGSLVDLERRTRTGAQVEEAQYGTREQRRDTAAREATARLEADAEQRGRAVALQRFAVAERAIEAERRQAIERGDTEAAAAQLARLDALGEARLQKQREQLARELEVREAYFRQLNIAMPQRERDVFGERGALIEEQATQQRNERAQRNADQLERAEEKVAATRARYTVEAIEDARKLETARIDAATKVAVAEAKRAGDIDATYRAQLEGIARVRDAELRAIADAANARAQAARGPQREEQILEIRRNEAAAVAQVNQRTVGQAAAVAESAEDARQKRRRDLAEAEADLERIQRDRFKRGTLGDLDRVQASARDVLDSPYVSEASKAAIEENLGRARMLADEQVRADREAERRAMEDREQKAFDRVQSLRGGIGAGGDTGPGTPLKVTRDEAGNAIIATDFDKAAHSADALTGKVKELADALKDLQASPGFAQKLSQDLADTLAFLGKRNP